MGMGMDNQPRLNAYMLEPAPPLTELPNEGRNRGEASGRIIKIKRRGTGKRRQTAT